MKNFDEYSFKEIMKIYRKKAHAEKLNEHSVLKYLKKEYPEIFSKEFEEFIKLLKMTIQYFKNKYDKDFYELSDEPMVCKS